MGNYDHLQSEGTRHEKIRNDEEMKTEKERKIGEDNWGEKKKEKE